MDVKSDFDWLVFCEDIDQERHTLRLDCQLSYPTFATCTICDKKFTSKVKMFQIQHEKSGQTQCWA